MGGAVEAIGGGVKDLLEGTGEALSFNFLKPDIPKIGDFPEFPKTDSASDLLKARVIASRLQAAAIPGIGRRATVATSAQGISTPAKITRPTLTGV